MQKLRNDLRQGEIYQNVKSCSALKSLFLVLKALDNMKVRFLIHIGRKDQQWIAKCPSISKTSAPCCSRGEAIGDLRKQLSIFIEIDVKKYISHWKGSGDTINCPEGFIELPIDLWKCKINKQLCPIQSQVYITDKEKFLVGCHAQKEKKEEIFNTIGNLKYGGFHHIPGRYLCRLCSGKEYRRYHYPWELTSLDAFFDLLDTEFKVRFLKANIDLAVYSGSLCPSHLKEVVSKIDPDIEKDLEFLELDFYR